MVNLDYLIVIYDRHASLVAIGRNHQLLRHPLLPPRSVERYREEGGALRVSRFPKPIGNGSNCTNSRWPEVELRHTPSGREPLLLPGRTLARLYPRGSLQAPD